MNTTYRYILRVQDIENHCICHTPCGHCLLVVMTSADLETVNRSQLIRAVNRATCLKTKYRAFGVAEK